MTCSGDQEGMEGSWTVSIAGNSVGAYGAYVQSVLEQAWKEHPSLFVGGMIVKTTVVSSFPDLLSVTIALKSGDSGRIGEAAFRAIGSLGAAIVMAYFAPVGFVGAALVGIAGFLGDKSGSRVWDELACPHVDPATDNLIKAAKRYVPPRRRDPLTLDLNGNGIAIIGDRPLFSDSC